MSVRLVSLLLVLIAVPAFSQQPCLSQRITQRIDSHEQRISQIAREPTSAEVDARAVRLQVNPARRGRTVGVERSRAIRFAAPREGPPRQRHGRKTGKRWKKLSKRLRQNSTSSLDLFEGYEGIATSGVPDAIRTRLPWGIQNSGF